MKLKKVLLSLASVAAIGFSMVPAANAVVLYAGANTYLGAYTTPPGSPTNNSFVRDQNTGFPVTAFDDYWIFTIAPDAGAEFSVNFIPSSGITGLLGGIYTATGFTCGVTCTGGSFGATAIIESGPPTVAFPGISTYLAAGTYAFRVQGTNTSNQTSYTGQFAFNAVPEPGSLALLGLGLMGLGLVRRRRA